MDSARTAVWLVSLVAVLAGWGCKAPERTAVAERHTSPEVKLVSAEAGLTVVVQAPSPGWAVELAESRREKWGTAIFLDLHRPDPSFIYPQVMVEQRILLPRTIVLPVRAYARVAAPNERVVEGIYNFAARSGPEPER